MLAFATESVCQGTRVGGAAFDHVEHRREDTSDGCDFRSVLIPCGWQCVAVPEQLVCAVNQMDVQGAAPRQPYRIGAGSINCQGGDSSWIA